MASIYHINKGINKPIEFKGLKAQYVTYLAIGLVVLLLAFAIMYIVGANLFVCIVAIVVAGTALFMSVFRLSHKYGQYGLLKKLSKRYIPRAIKFKSRKLFLALRRDGSLRPERRKHGECN